MFCSTISSRIATWSDLVVVSWTQIWVVELKHWSGTIEVAPYTWVRNGSKRVADPHRNNSFKCKVLRASTSISFPHASVGRVCCCAHAPRYPRAGHLRSQDSAEQGTSNPTLPALMTSFLP